MRCFLKSICYLFLGMQLLTGITAVADELTYENVGIVPTNERVKAWDISIGPEGKELPPGEGTAREGEKIYNQKCAYCHGPSASGGAAVRLAVTPAERKESSAWAFMGVTGWPYATTIWSYIHKAMPVGAEDTLTDDEVYSLTAYLLSISGIIDENTVISSSTLPAIEMPSRGNFFPKLEALEWNPDDHRLYGIYDNYPEDESNE